MKRKLVRGVEKDMDSNFSFVLLVHQLISYRSWSPKTNLETPNLYTIDESLPLARFKQNTTLADTWWNTSQMPTIGNGKLREKNKRRQNLVHGPEWSLLTRVLLLVRLEKMLFVTSPTLDIIQNCL